MAHTLKRWSVLLAICAGFVATASADDATAVPGSAADVSESVPVPVNDASLSMLGDVADPAFDRYIDPSALSKALRDHDAAGVADAIGRFKAARETLLRERKGMSVADMIAVAAGFASENRDATTSERLAELAAAENDDALVAAVDRAKLLAAASRGEEEPASKPLSTMTPAQFALAQCGGAGPGSPQVLLAGGTRSAVEEGADPLEAFERISNAWEARSAILGGEREEEEEEDGAEAADPNALTEEEAVAGVLEATFDPSLLGEAWYSFDASALVDATIDLKRAEGAMGFKHPLISSDGLFDLSIEIGKRTGDAEAIRRLVAFAGQIGAKDGAERAERAVLLAAQSRGDDESVTVKPGEIDADQYALLVDSMKAVDRAWASQDAEAASAAVADLREAELGVEAAQAIIERAEQVRADLAEPSDSKVDPQLIAQLDLLSAVSRMEESLTPNLTEQVDAYVKLSSDRRAYFEAQVKAVDTLCGAMEKAANASVTFARARQIQDVVVELRRAQLDGKRLLQEARAREDALTTTLADSMKLLRGRYVTRAGVREGWAAVMLMHEQATKHGVSAFDQPIEEQSIYSPTSWIKVGSTALAASPPQDIASAIEMFGWASQKNQVPRPGTAAARLLAKCIELSDGALMCLVAENAVKLEDAQTRLGAIRASAIKAIEVAHAPK
jgi:hypothetical protein